MKSAAHFPDSAGGRSPCWRWPYPAEAQAQAPRIDRRRARGGRSGWPAQHGGGTLAARRPPGGAGAVALPGPEVYQASLWVAPGFSPRTFAEHPFALGARVPARLPGRLDRRALASGDAAPGPDHEEQARRWQQALQQVLPDVKPGDRIVGLHRPGKGALSSRAGGCWARSPTPGVRAPVLSASGCASTSAPALRDALPVGAGQGRSRDRHG